MPLCGGVTEDPAPGSLSLAIGVQRGSCGACAPCGAGRENVCAQLLKTYGGPGNDKGGFQRTIRYPADWVFACPEGLRPELVGPLM